MLLETKILYGIILCLFLYILYTKNTLEKMTDSSISQENLLAIKNLGQLAARIMPDSSSDDLVFPGNVTIDGLLTVNNGSRFNGGRHYFKDSEKSTGNGLRVGALWDKYGIYSEDGDVAVASKTGKVQIQNNKLTIDNGSISTTGSISADSSISSDNSISAAGGKVVLSSATLHEGSPYKNDNRFKDNYYGRIFISGPNSSTITSGHYGNLALMVNSSRVQKV